MNVSNTYRRGRMQSSMNHLAEKSSDLIDYRARLVYISIRRKHPFWNPAIVKGIATNRALFVTIFQAPLEWFGRIRMKIRLLFAKKRKK